MSIAHLDAETGFSGGEAQVFLLMEGLRRRGHRNVLICPAGSEAEREARSRRLETRPVAMRNDLDLASIWALKRELCALKQAAPKPGLSKHGFLESESEASPLDLVHLHTGRATWLGGIAARWAGLPALSTRRMDRPVKRNWRNRWIYGSLVRRIVAISPAVASCLAQAGVQPERTVLIPSSIDPEALRPSRPRAALRADLGLSAETQVLSAVGALVARKGIDVLLEAFAQVVARRSEALPELELWILGEGPERERLHEQAQALGLSDNDAGTRFRLRFWGTRDDVSDLLAASDVFVMPSRREGLGVAALEALAANLPVIASRVGGLADLLGAGPGGDEAGFLVEPGDPEVLAGALRRVLEDAELRARLERAGPERLAQGYLAEQMVSAYEELYREILNERESAGR